MGYLGQLRPTVGGGLGGLPVRPAAGGGGGAVIEGEAVLTSKPILQHLYGHQYNGTTSNTGGQLVTLSGSIVDIRNCVFDFNMGGSFQGQNAHRVIFPEINLALRGIGFKSPSSSYAASVALHSANKVKVYNNYPARFWITVTEYDAKPINAAVISDADYTSAPVGDLPFEIQNIKNVYCMGFYQDAGQSAWNFKGNSPGSFQTHGFNTDTGPAVATMPKATFGYYDVDGEFYIDSPTTFRTSASALSGTRQVGIIEWEN